MISVKLLGNFNEIALWHVCSPVNLLHIFKTPFSKNTSWWLLLEKADVTENNRCLMDKSCFWNVNIFLCQNRSTISFSVQTSSSVGFLSIYYHQFVYRQNVNTDVVYQIQFKSDLYFSQHREFFQYDYFYQNNLTKST